MKVSSISAARPALFTSVRSSRDLSLAAFAAALLAAFALHAGAFLPRVAPAGQDREATAVQLAPGPAKPAVVANKPVPCETPRG